jgi:hypothetical protein
MRPTWLFEADVFGQTAEPLKAETRRQGMACFVTRQQLLSPGSCSFAGGRRLADDACVIACGSHPFVRHILLHFPWAPGGWCSPENLDCQTYYAHFGPYLLNQRRAILTGVEATQQGDALFARFGRDDRVFVRPSGCQKLFTGRVVQRPEFADAIAPARYNAATLVVVAEPQDITREWRLVVADGAVIAGSQYWADDRIDIQPGCPDTVRAFAAQMLAEVHWQPDELFLMDVCESREQLRLLELNSFSCSALYLCDLKAVVAIASELAVRAWERQRDGSPHLDLEPA